MSEQSARVMFDESLTFAFSCVQEIRHPRGSSVRRSAGTVSLLLLPLLAVGRASVHCRSVAGLSGTSEGRRHRVRFAAGAARPVSEVLLALNREVNTNKSCAEGLCLTPKQKTLQG